MAAQINLTVYRLRDPKTSAVRYVGQHRHGMIRAQSYSKLVRRGHVPHGNRYLFNAIKQMHEQGCEPLAEEIVSGLETQEQADQIEDFYICLYREIGHGLTNIRRGGSRGTHSPETIIKMKTAHRGKKLSAETRRNIGEVQRGRKQSQELIEKRIGPLRGRKRPPFSAEWRAKISEGQRKRFGTSEMRVSRHVKASPEETRQKRSDAAKRRWARQRASR